MKIKHTISFDKPVISEINTMAKTLNKDRSEIVNDLCLMALQIQNSKEVERVYSPMIEQLMSKHHKAFEERIASLMAKNALDSAMSMFLLLDSISKSRKVEATELYNKTRGIAAKHLQKREDLLGMLGKKESREPK